MKLKSLLLGSAAAVALTSGAFAADPRASFVSLDVCDAYGITGLTIASSDTCLKISGHVEYEFRIGDYGPGVPWYFAYGDGGGIESIDDNDGTTDWRSRLEALLRFEATTQTDAGAAKAVLVLRERQRSGGGVDAGDTGHNVRFEQAYVSFGDTTVLMAGMKGSIGKFGSDEPYNYLGLFNSSKVDTGVDWKFGDLIRTGGTSIQVTTEFGDGISAGIGLENINRWTAPGGFNVITTDARAGTLVGFVEAKGAWGEAHLTVLADDALNSFANAVWGFHAGATAKFDQFALTAALSGNSQEYFNGLISGQATFDLFTIAASAEFASVGAGNPSGPGVDVTGLGFGGSVGFQATDTVKINLGARYWDWDSGDAVAAGTEVWQIALGASFEVSDGLTVDGAVGYKTAGTFAALPDDGAFYGELGVAYKPGGGFETGAGLEVNSYGAYKLKFNAKKTF
ncbi:porin [Pelagibacterium limicola]|uniref:porin n=1 Tax=Pelagibacterium limicola TaxID=2791022 RepID=UPI0018AFB5D2|nr:porin [Pelagibacterium limicola]